MKKQILIGLILVLTVALSGCIGSSSSGSGGVVSISLSDLSSQAKFYTFDDNGVQISYFAVLGSDGVARTAFDACDVCGGSKGYRQEGNNIVCNNCGQTFSIDGLGTENKGYGCWPSYLPHKESGGNILIDINDIKEGRNKFT